MTPPTRNYPRGTQHDTPLAAPPPARDRTVLSVSELNREARVTIEHRFNQVWVMGEMSNFARPRSGHWYFTLKDESAQVRCAMFANRNRAVRAQPGDGQLFIVRGRVSLYEGRGEFQIIVDHMEPAGEGALRQAFDQLKVRLADEGLFDQARKRPLPPFPEHVAVISSATGAAIHDALAVWRRRYPVLNVTLLPVAVQGAEAEPQILEALTHAETLRPDAILLTRGGGSLEDLWAFNSEQIARRIDACDIPVVAAIGHEIDITIADFVADVRAPTPSAAAEMLTPDIGEMADAMGFYEDQFTALLRRGLAARAGEVAALRQRLRNPERILEQARLRVDDNAARLARALKSTARLQSAKLARLETQLRAAGPGEHLRATRRQLHGLSNRLNRAWHTGRRDDATRLSALARMLESVSPLPTIARGYGVVMAEAHAVTSVADLGTGQTVTTYLSDGAFDATVTAVDTGRTLNPLPDAESEDL